MRYVDLFASYEGLKRLGLYFVNYKNGTYFPAGISDDLGIYYFIPKIALLFNISMERATLWFFNGVIIIAFILGVVGIMFLFKSRIGKVTGILALVSLALLEKRIWDVYLVYGATIMALTPITLYFVKNKIKSYQFAIFVFLIGICTSFSDFLRASSGYPVIIFILFLVLVSREIKINKKVFILASLFCGFIMPKLIFGQMLDKRDDYLLKNHYITEAPLRQHVIWHSIYIGLGYLPNSYGIEYQDQNGFDKVESIAPGTALCSSEYEAILKKETLKIVHRDPKFVAKVVLAKTEAIVLFPFDPRAVGKLSFICIAGLIAAVWFRKGWVVDCAFGLMGLLAASNGILVMPRIFYILSFVALVVIYSTISIDFAISQGALIKIVSLFKKIKIR